MAEECLRLATAADNRHAISYNNLGVLEMKKKNITPARTYFHAAASIAGYMHEPHFNSALLAHAVCIYFKLFIISLCCYFYNHYF